MGVKKEDGWRENIFGNLFFNYINILNGSIYILYDPTFPLIGISLTERTNVHQNVCTKLLVVELFVIAPNWKLS